MTQEDEELLLKDLCARLPYGIKIHLNANMYPNWKGDYNLTAIKSIKSSQVQCSVKHFSCWCNLEDVRPYLFPMSSMTDRQYDIMYGITENDRHDWLNANHFDYRGLIEKGLALDATGLNIY